METLVSTDWLAGELGAADLKPIDASWFLPDSGRDARAEYEKAHIPGAVFLDLDAVSDPDSDLPHMLPSPARFASRMRALGIGDQHRIVVYDNSPLHSAARLWWMLHMFGARRVALLDGGFGAWQAEGWPVEPGTPPARTGHFTASPVTDGVIDKHGLLSLERCAEIVDARPAPRFRGEEDEPRPGLVAGHIPGARNLPQSKLFEDDGRWKRGKALREAFADAGVDLSRPMVVTCGSGITAAVLLFGAHLLGKEDVTLYDGSWAEWGADPATPKATGDE